MGTRTVGWLIASCLACTGGDDAAASGEGGTAMTSAASASSNSGGMSTNPAESSSGATSDPTSGATTEASSSSGEATASSSSSGGVPQTIHFAAIGDYGTDDDDEAAVAALVDSWDPEFVITMGDNNYPDGEARTIDPHIGQYYHHYIGNYVGTYGEGAAENRFWPSPGNHDWNTDTLQPYTDYFTLPGNERYYEVDLGLVHLFAVDSDSHEPDGITSDSVQAQWLQAALAASTACWKVVYFHHAAYSSADHGSDEDLQWPYEEWGADVVMAGHDHSYERLAVGGIPYFVNGLGGAGLYDFKAIVPESVVRYNESHGAMSITASSSDMTFEFVTVEGEVIDTHTIRKSCS
jgi:tartrate-resistant acid phosphatase type 5